MHTENTVQPTSKLIIEKAHPADSGKKSAQQPHVSLSHTLPPLPGNYSCVYDAAEPAHVAVHVLPNGGHPAAIQHGKRSAGDFVRSRALTATLNSLIFYFLSLLPFAVTLSRDGQYLLPA